MAQPYIYVECYSCGKDLDIIKVKADMEYDITFYVEPCPECMENAASEACEKLREESA